MLKPNPESLAQKPKQKLAHVCHPRPVGNDSVSPEVICTTISLKNFWKWARPVKLSYNDSLVCFLWTIRAAVHFFSCSFFTVGLSFVIFYFLCNLFFFLFLLFSISFSSSFFVFSLFPFYSFLVLVIHEFFILFFLFLFFFVVYFHKNDIF